MRTTNELRADGLCRPRRTVTWIVAATWCSAVVAASLVLAAPIERIPDKVRRYAQRLLQRHDADNDGKLQRAEWGKMQGSPESTDGNGDGVITLDELASAIAAYGRNRRIGSASVGQDGAPRATAAEAGPAPASGEPPQRSATFHVPKSRLPPGLPEWFLRRDLDGDGQLSLSEHSPSPTQADLDEFARYDRNGDGFITAKECLAALRPAKPAAGKGAAKKSGP